MLAIIAQSTVLGNFTTYTGVTEIALGLERFTPAAKARPTTGMAGLLSQVPTIVLTTYADTQDDGALTEALEAIFAIHPWEIPIIEIDRVQLPIRAGLAAEAIKKA